MELITDRTASDAMRLKSLRTKGWGNMTDAEREEFLTASKGAYNVSDLNRVESAVDYIQNYLNGLQAVLDAYREEHKVADDPSWNVPWDVLDLVIKTDWTVEDIPTESDLARYLSNVDIVTNALEIVKSLPNSMEFLDFRGANEIERALLSEYSTAQEYEANTKQLINNTVAAFIYSGEVYGGEI